MAANRFSLGKKKKAAKKAKKKQEKLLKKERKMLLKEMLPKDYKSKCCEKYMKSERKRCKRCPCFDLLQKVA